MSSTTEASHQRRGSRISVWVKLAYTLFMLVLVPYYWHAYGPTNFLFFCDLALFITLAGIWMESAWLASMAAVGILLPQALWMVDFLSTAVGYPLLGMTAYMFDSKYTLFVRGLSFFHFWLPIMLVLLVWRLGYDKRALWSWIAVAWLVLPVCYFLMPAPPAPVDQPNQIVNINYVYGLSELQPQSWMAGWAWFTLLLFGLPIAIYWPTHLILTFLFGRSGCCRSAQIQ
jgi:hypothetical protein